MWGTDVTAPSLYSVSKTYWTFFTLYSMSRTYCTSFFTFYSVRKTYCTSFFTLYSVSKTYCTSFFTLYSVSKTYCTSFFTLYSVSKTNSTTFCRPPFKEMWKFFWKTHKHESRSADHKRPLGILPNPLPSSKTLMLEPTSLLNTN
jgi:hypothetical protein